MANEKVIFELQAEIRKATKEINNLKKQFGQVDDQVQKTQKSTNLLEGSLKKAGQAFAAFAGLGAVTKMLQQSVKTIADFESELAKLSSITGAVGKDLDFLAKKAVDLSVKSSQAATDVLKAFSLVGSAKPELLKSADALAEVTKQAITLSEAAGITVPEAADALTRSLNQFGKSAQDAAKFTDILATSQQKGTGRVQFMTAAMQKAGSVAKTLNIDFETTNAILQGFAKGGIAAEISGTAFASIMSRLAEVGNDDFNPTITDAVDVINNLAESNLTVVDANKLVGVEMGKYLLTLTSQVDIINELNGNLWEHGNAAEQAATNTSTLNTEWKNLTKNWQNLQIALGGESGAVKSAVKETADDLGEMAIAMQTTTEEAANMGKVMLFLTKTAALLGNKNAREALVQYNEVAEQLNSTLDETNDEAEELTEEQEELVRTYGDIKKEITELIKDRDKLSTADTKEIEAINKKIEALLEEKKTLTELGIVTKDMIKLAEEAEEKRIGGILKASRERLEFEALMRELERLNDDLLAEGVRESDKEREKAEKEGREKAILFADFEIGLLKEKEKVALLGISSVASSTASATEEGSAIQKGAAIAEGTINAYLAFNQALATLPPPLGAIVGAANLALGLANVKRVASFAEGGFTGTGDFGKDKDGPIAGVVHQNEFVFDREKTSKLRPLFEDIHNDRLNINSLADLTRRGTIHNIINADFRTERMEHELVMLRKEMKNRPAAFYDDERLKVRGNTVYKRR